MGKRGAGKWRGSRDRERGAWIDVSLGPENHENKKLGMREAEDSILGEMRSERSVGGV